MQNRIAPDFSGSPLGRAGGPIESLSISFSKEKERVVIEERKTVKENPLPVADQANHTLARADLSWLTMKGRPHETLNPLDPTLDTSCAFGRRRVPAFTLALHQRVLGAD
jgi:hypothetical protein